MEALVVIGLIVGAYCVGHTMAVRRLGWRNMKGGWKRWRSGKL